MAISFEVGAVFKILDQASPVLSKILKQVRTLSAEIDKAKASMGSFGTSVAGIGTAAGETQALATAWREVATASAAATRNIGAATAVNRRAISAASGGAIFGGGGGRGGRRGGGGHGGPGAFGNLHVSSIGTRIPGGHAYMRGGNAALAGAGAVGYIAYEEAEMEDALTQLRYHLEMVNNPANNEQLRGILQRTHSKTGKPMKEIVDAALTEARMFKGTPGGGLGVMEEILKGASTEALIKGSGLPESLNALVGLAHMTKAFSGDAIKKLIPTFAMLSSANPDKLAQIERAASYAVPTLQSGLGVDPGMALLAATVLRRGGATSSKGGTWLRELAERSMPSSSSMSEKARAEHNALLEKAGLRKDGKALNLAADGSLDLLKTIDLVNKAVEKMSFTEKGGLEKALYGERGKGALNILGSTGSRDQLQSLWTMLQDPGQQARSGGFMDMYNKESPVQQFRTTMASFQDALTNLGTLVLPSATGALRDFKSIIEDIKGLIPHPDAKTPGADKWKVGTRALEGAGIGAAIGFMFAGIGAGPGAAIGGTIGGIAGIVEGINATKAAADQAVTPLSSYNSDVVITGNSANQAAGGLSNLAGVIRGLAAAAQGGVFPGGTSTGPGGGASKMNFLSGPRTGNGGARIINAKVHMKKQFVGTMTASIVEDAAGPIQGMVYPDATRRQSRNDHSHAVA